MKPKTKLQKQVIELSQQLPSITVEQKEWAFRYCFEHKGYKTKKGIACLDCGHRWKDSNHELLIKIDGCTCPKCGTKLQVLETRKRKDRQDAYFGIVTTKKGIQVIRFFDITAHYRVGEQCHYSLWEIAQHWITSTGRYEVIARNHTTGWHIDSWNGDLEIRNKYNGNYSIEAYRYYPKRGYIPQVKRNGFQGKTHGLTLSKILRLILGESKAETLLKARQYDLLKYYSSFPKKISDHWPSIRICLRNNYIVPDASLWFDYLAALAYMGKDLYNAKYVCPENLEKEHDHWDKKKREQERKERIEKERRELAEAEAKYKKAKSVFFDLELSNGEITIRPLKSVQEFYDEGKAMHHCVRGYYSKEDCLILSATKGDERIATIELSLKSFDVIQCRGVCNKKPEYYEQIIQLLKDNITQIRRRLRRKGKKIKEYKITA
ncbi:MAG: PcfJ domain-containing protein [Tannerellaceae bacterium]|nr:PcfJ domain-containing protein [Tannerellaceae bacterium]